MRLKPETEDFLVEVAQHAFGVPESLRFTYETTRRLLADGVPGDLVECGVAAGVHPAAMAVACHDAKQKRTVRLFDSFEGIPHAGPRDGEFVAQGYGDGSGDLRPAGMMAVSLEAVAANLKAWGVDDFGIPVVLHPGWFQDTMPAAAAAWSERGEGIAFLRLDGDLYESTLVCLQHLYPLVRSGGCVVVDDWNLDGCKQAVRDYFESTPLPCYEVSWSKETGPVYEPAGDVVLVPETITITESGDVWWTKP